MATEQKPEKKRTKTTTPATEQKANGKRKIKNDEVPKELPTIVHCSSSNSHNTNGTKSTSKSSQQQQQMKVSGEVIVVDDDDDGEERQLANGSDMIKTTKKVKDEVETENSLLYQIPMNRVSRIIKSEDSNIRITQEAVYIINKASVLLISLTCCSG